jgi:hypothetical protein
MYSDGLTASSELIDKCVGSRIWVVMKGDKGEDDIRSKTIAGVVLTNKSDLQSSREPYSVLTTTSVCIRLMLSIWL